MDGCLSRTERIPADKQKRLPGVANIGLGIDAVGQPRLVVPLVAEAGDVQKILRKRGSFLDTDGVGVHVGGSGMLQGAGGTAVLQRLPVETLRVVAAREVVTVVDCEIHLAQIYILIKRADVVVAA